VKISLSRLLKEQYDGGVRKFYILGGSDLAGLIEMVIREQGQADCQLLRVETITSAMADGMLLICRENIDAMAVPGIKAVNVIEELAKDEALLYQTSTEERGFIHA
jgi:hypothetical protein